MIFIHFTMFFDTCLDIFEVRNDNISEKCNKKILTPVNPLTPGGGGILTKNYQFQSFLE